MAAVVSAFFAYSSANIAKKALKLSKSDFDEKHEKLKLHLIDAVVWMSGDTRVASFACSFTNGANAPNTLIRVELIVDAYDSKGALTRVILDPVIQDIPDRWNLTRLSLPVNLQPRSTNSGWISFRLPSNLHHEKRIDRYRVAVLNSMGERESLDAYLLKEIENATDQG